ncbi:MAG TPA: hypothetical protein DCZ94_22600 [Lentisphaeria bacterium]|nr:MAG: hypothetical protein A2X48_13845 [Lentisphaerae bacterium GWF2_49_21]HBC89739.1 hypothetical protein [Lentisphaeria bacterium]
MKFNKKKIVYAIMALLVFIPALLVLFFLLYTPSPSEITLSGDSARMGETFGRETGFRTKLILRYYIKSFICQGSDKLYDLRKQKALEKTRFLTAEFQEEMKAISKRSGIDPGAIAYGNSFLDMGNYSGGCRSVVVSEKDSFLHSHNLDWDNIAGLAGWTTMIVRRNPSDGRCRTVSIGFSGMIGALDVINEKGIAMSFNQLGFGNGNYTEPVFIMLRRICENSCSFNEAREKILKASEGMPFIITLSDANSGEASVFERTRGGNEIAERKMKGRCIGAMNLAQADSSKESVLDQSLSGAVPNGVEGLKRILSEKKVMMDSNIYSVIFDFKSNSLYLASGEVPAAKGTYRKYKLF